MKKATHVSLIMHINADVEAMLMNESDAAVLRKLVKAGSFDEHFDSGFEMMSETEQLDEVKDLARILFNFAA